MTQEEFDKAPLLDQILYDETGMLVENHPSIAEAMEKYHQAKLKLLGIGAVMRSASISGCELMKCKYYVDGKCADPNEWVNENGDAVCGLREDAILVE